MCFWCRNELSAARDLPDLHALVAELVLTFMRLIVNATTLRMEFHPAEDGGTTKTPDDTVTLNLKT
jgi:hypothetical protein